MRTAPRGTSRRHFPTTRHNPCGRSWSGGPPAQHCRRFGQHCRRFGDSNLGREAIRNPYTASLWGAPFLKKPRAVGVSPRWATSQTPPVMSMRGRTMGTGPLKSPLRRVCTFRFVGLTVPEALVLKSTIIRPLCPLVLIFIRHPPTPGGRRPRLPDAEVCALLWATPCPTPHLGEASRVGEWPKGERAVSRAGEREGERVDEQAGGKASGWAVCRYAGVHVCGCADGRAAAGLCVVLLAGSQATPTHPPPRRKLVTPPHGAGHLRAPSADLRTGALPHLRICRWTPISYVAWCGARPDQGNRRC